MRKFLINRFSLSLSSIWPRQFETRLQSTKVSQRRETHAEKARAESNDLTYLKQSFVRRLSKLAHPSSLEDGVVPLMFRLFFLAYLQVGHILSDFSRGVSPSAVPSHSPRESECEERCNVPREITHDSRCARSFSLPLALHKLPSFPRAFLRAVGKQ